MLCTAHLGLPVVPPWAAKSFMVVGAGVAGLTAALELALAGHTVKIYEASQRVGGRVETYREPELGWLSELGAMRLPLDVHPILNTYVRRRFRLPVGEFINDLPDYTIMMLNGRQGVTTAFAQRNPSCFGFGTTPAERHLTPGQLWAKAIEPILDIAATLGWDHVMDQYDEFSVYSYLFNQGISIPAINYIALVLNLESNLFTAIAESVRDAAIINDSVRFYHIVGGNDQLPHSLAAACLAVPGNRCSIFFNRTVAAVDISSDGITAPSAASSVKVVWYDSNDELMAHPPPKARARVAETYNQVILATTAAALRTMDLQPALAFVHKRTALRQLHYDCASKVVLNFAQQWWRQAPFHLTGGHSITDSAVRFVFYFNFNRTTPKDQPGSILASYTWSQDALLWQSLPDETAKRLALLGLIAREPPHPNPHRVTLHIGPCEALVPRSIRTRCVRLVYSDAGDQPQGHSDRIRRPCIWTRAFHR
jgi:monoamine oxidase